MVPEIDLHGLTIDLHGLTRDEALAEVDRELNHAFIQETEDRRLRFITGRGLVLHRKVREYLSDHPLIKDIEISGSAILIRLEEL